MFCNNLWGVLKHQPYIILFDYQVLLCYHIPLPFGHLLYLRGGVFH